MKRVISLALLMLVLAGCKKKEQVYENDLNGTWTASDYLLNNIDEYSQFQQVYKNYTITFSGGKTFTETYLLNSDTPAVSNHGTYYFSDYYQQIVLADTMYIPIDSVHVYDSVFLRTYTLFDLSSASVQFRTDTSAIYLVKKTTP